MASATRFAVRQRPCSAPPRMCCRYAYAFGSIRLASPRQAKDPSRSSHQETWRSPAGISGIAAAVTCVLAVITFLVIDVAGSEMDAANQRLTSGAGNRPAEWTPHKPCLSFGRVATRRPPHDREPVICGPRLHFHQNRFIVFNPR